MSEVMLYGVLEMPYELAMSSELSRLQYWQRGQQAATELRQAADTIDAQRKLLEQARDAQQTIVDHNCFGRWIPEQPDDGWRPKSQVLFDSIDAITEHLKAHP